ncbi:hypothetical protein V8F33_012352 [Rhypophila sp. PSN 637]
MLANILTLLAVTVAAAPAVTAVGNAKVVNKCTVPVYLWSVGGNVSGVYTLAAKTGTYSEPFVKDPVTGGKALKITKTKDGLYTGKAQTVFAYSLDGDKVWYDLSDVFGDAFAGAKIVEASADTTCPAITWPTGIPPAGSQVKVCTAAKDVTLTLCA